jgi:hypothetical protein
MLNARWVQRLTCVDVGVDLKDGLNQLLVGTRRQGRTSFSLAIRSYSWNSGSIDMYGSERKKTSESTKKTSRRALSASINPVMDRQHRSRLVSRRLTCYLGPHCGQHLMG